MPRCSIIAATLFTLIGAISLIAADETQPVTWELTPLASQPKPGIPPFEAAVLSEQATPARKSDPPVTPVRRTTNSETPAPQTWNRHSGSSTAPTLISYRTVRRSDDVNKMTMSGSGWAKSSQTTPFDRKSYARPGETLVVAKPVSRRTAQPVVARVVARRRIRNVIPTTTRTMETLPQFALQPLGPVKPQVSLKLAKSKPPIVIASRSRVIAVEKSADLQPVRTTPAPQVVMELKPSDDSEVSGKAHVVRQHIVEDVKDGDAGYVVLHLKPLANPPIEQPLVFNMTSHDLGPAQSAVTDSAPGVVRASNARAAVGAPSPQLVGSTRSRVPVLDFVPINQVQVMSAVHAPVSENPKYNEPDDLADLINQQYAPIHNWGAPQWYTFKPSRNTFPFKHNPLYFEDPNLERCGQSKGCLTTLSSAVQFFSTVPQLPIRILEKNPRECVCARPDCPTCHEFKDAP